MLRGLAFSSASQAFEVFTDYTPSTEVWNVAMVRVNPNRIDDYLEGLKQTRLTGCEAGKKQGTVVDCYAYLSETAANRDFNMLLVTSWSKATRNCGRSSASRTSGGSTSSKRQPFSLPGGPSRPAGWLASGPLQRSGPARIER
jgi:hypothetical protein